MSQDRAWWDLGRASSDVIEGHCSKHSSDVGLGFERCENIFGVFVLENGQDFYMKEVNHLAIQFGV